MTPCLAGCALTYASARGAHTHKVNESLNAVYIVREEATTSQPLFSAAAADRPNRSNSSGGGTAAEAASYERAGLRTSVCFMSPGSGGCASCGSVKCALCGLSAVLCHVCSVFFVGMFYVMIRTYVVRYVMRELITLLTL